VVRHNGNRRSLVCGYHGWTYGLDGKLLVAPSSEEEPGFDKCVLGLQPVSVHVWGPVVFVNADPDARPFEETHPGFMAMVGERQFNLDLDAWQFETRVDYNLKTNWKLAYDNDAECYHCNVLHSVSFGDAFATKKGEYELKLFDALMTYQFFGTSHQRDNKLRSRFYRSFQIYPAGIFIQHDELMLIHQINPTGPESAYTWYDIFSLKGSDRIRVDAWLDLWRKTLTEDFEAVSLQQECLRAGRIPYSRFVEPQEAPLKHTSSLIWKDYKGALVTRADQ
jgi:hypothetical protein